jgi:transcription antitermination factor NusG
MPEGEVEALQNALSIRRSEPHPFFSAGERVRIRRGPLENLEGVVVRQKGQSLMIVSVDFICRSVAIQLEAADLQGLARARSQAA